MELKKSLLTKSEEWDKLEKNTTPPLPEILVEEAEAFRLKFHSQHTRVEYFYGSNKTDMYNPLLYELSALKCEICGITITVKGKIINN